MSLPGTEAFYQQALSLPLFPDMTEEEVDYVVETLRTITKGAP
jgi:dTDP-4-amino-4,6-dideoxygalactose transaminase